VFVTTAASRVFVAVATVAFLASEILAAAASFSSAEKSSGSF